MGKDNVNSKTKKKGDLFAIFKYAGKGLSYVKNVVKRNDDYELNKLEGDELLEELNRVKSESNDFKNVVASQDTAKDKKLIAFNYVVKNAMGEVVKGTFDAEDITAVRVFLTNEGYEIISIKARTKLQSDINVSNKIKTGDLAFGLVQLSTYIKAGIPLVDSMRILSKQTSKPQLRRIYDRVVYQLVIGEPFSRALEKQNGAFPNILINMVKTSEMTGDLAGTLDEMADYFTETDKTRKEMISALIYPSVILVMVIAVLFFLVLFVVPQFIDMFENQNAELPGITKFVISVSSFIGKYWWVIILGVLATVFVFKWLYANVREFRRTVQIMAMKFPVLGKVIIYSEVANITRTFSSLLNHGVFITDSMEILTTLTNNEVYKEIMSRTMIGLSKGAKLSETFKGEWAFPLVAYEMLVTGESTGQLALMMQKVAEHFSSLHHNAVTVLKSLLEPFVIILLAVSVGFILMSIILPMFDLYSQI